MRFLWDLPVSWLLLPLKIVLVIPVYIFMQTRNFLYKKNPKYWSKGVRPIRNHWDIVIDMIDKSPVYKSYSYSVYMNRVPIEEKPNGMNQNPDHQCMRQGLWVNLMKHAFGKADHSQVLALESHFNKELARGYKLKDGKLVEFNHEDVSGDMVAGWCMGYLAESHLMSFSTIKLAEHIMKHGGIMSKGKMSPRGCFKPGLQFGETVAPIPVGAQNLTYLAILKCGIDAYRFYCKEDRKVMGLNSYWKLKLEYWLRFYIYLDCITVLMPTVGIWFRRAYNNDNCCIQFAYVCAKLSGGIERMFYEFSLLYVWSLSWPWLNGFFSGMVNDATGLLTESYMNRCRKYAEDYDGIITGGGYQQSTKPAKFWPIDPYEFSFDEFCCDENQEYDDHNGKREGWSTLGQIANLIYSNLRR